MLPKLSLRLDQEIAALHGVLKYAFPCLLNGSVFGLDLRCEVAVTMSFIARSQFVM